MIEARIPDNEEERLLALRALKILDTMKEERFDRITRLACASLGVRASAISLTDRSRTWVKSIIGLDATESPRAVSFCSHAILSDKILIVPDASVDPRFSDNPWVMDNPKIRFYAGYPLSTAPTLRVGTLCVIDYKPMTLSQEKIDILCDLGKLAEEELNRQ